MSRFAPALRRAARELDLPRTIRSAILSELAADLEAVFAHHRAHGLSDEEAARRAEEQILGSAEVIRRLGRLHEGSWRRWPEEIGARLSGGVDLMLLALGVLPVLLVAAGVAFDAITSGPASPLVWPLCVIGTLLAGAIPAELIRLLRGAPARPHRLRLLLSLSTLAPAMGLLALVHGAYDIATTLGAATSTGETQILIAAIAIRDGAALLTALLLAIAGGLSWFALLNRSAEQVAREVDRILEGPPADETGTAHPAEGERHEFEDKPGAPGELDAPEDRRAATERKIIPLARGRSA